MLCTIKVIIFSLFTAYFVWAAISFKRNFPKMRRAWNKIGKFNNYLIINGCILLVPAPLLQHLLGEESAWSDFFYSAFPAIATGFLVAGLIEYSKAMLEENE